MHPSALKYLAPVLLCTAGVATAETLVYGDKDLMGMGGYVSDRPEFGAKTEGLQPGETKVGLFKTYHAFPFRPLPGDAEGTDQVYVGSNQQATLDEYSKYGGSVKGPQVFKIDYSSIVPDGGIATATLGIMIDDAQYPTHRQPFVVTVNGTEAVDLSEAINRLDLRDPENRPLTAFVSAGLDPAILNSDHVLEVSIDQGADGGDGWAVDYVTVGLTGN